MTSEPSGRWTHLPSYAELVRDHPDGSAAAIDGIDPRLGMLSLIDADKVKEAVGLVRHGRVIRLDAPLDLLDPPPYQRAPMRVNVLNPRTYAFDETLDSWNTQGSSQWDGFRHIKNPTSGFFAGLDAEQHGVDHWARHGIVTRGVLADVGRYRESIGRPLALNDSDPIDVSDVEGALAQAGVSPLTGDALLVRTGWLGWYARLTAQQKVELSDARVKAPGLRTGPEFIEYLWDAHISCVAADNPALEVSPIGGLVDGQLRRAAAADPARLVDVAMHYTILALHGIPIGELWALDELAEDCASDGTYEFLMSSAPLMLSRGVASPPNAVAIK